MSISSHRDSRLQSALLASLASVVGVLLPISIGTATAPAIAAGGNCTDASDDWSTYRNYVDSFGRVVPLRCGYWNGTKGWGVMKLQAKRRWNVWYRDMIGATLEHPQSHWAQNATTDVYVTAWQTKCNPVYRFRVVVNTSSKAGKAHMMGVVNAYEERR